MREILSEIWMEARSFPIIMFFKLLLVFVLLFSGVLLRGFPYGIVVYSFLCSLDLMLLYAPEIDFFLPRSREAWYRMKRGKCLLAGVFYAGVAAGGYILNVVFTGRYALDVVHIGEIWMIFSLSFLIMFLNRVQMEQIRYQEDVDEEGSGAGKKWFSGDVAFGFMAYMLMVSACIVDFGEVSFLLFLQQDRFRLLGILLYIGTVAYLLFQSARSLGELKQVLGAAGE